MFRSRLLAGLAAVATLAACSPTVHTDPAPSAESPECAQLLMSTPDEIAGFERSSTTSQGTTAWGPGITFRCGVPVPGPSTDRCITVGENPAADGPSGIDWLSLEADDPRLPDNANGGVGTWTFISYGRDPAVEVVLSVEAVGNQLPVDLLEEFEGAVRQSPASRHCLGLTDAPTVTDEQ